MRVVDRFAAAVIITPSGEMVTSPAGKVVRVPASSKLMRGSDDGTLLGPDRKKVGTHPF